MPFVLSFVVTQGVDSTSFTLVDSSTGSDASVATRRIVVTTSSGVNLVPIGVATTYIQFPFSDGASKVVTVLPIDYALSVELQYLNAGGTVLYALSQNYVFTGNDNDFDYSLTQQLAANQSLMQDFNYVINRLSLRMLIDSSENAVITGNDINGAQFCLDLAQKFVDNQTTYF